MASSKKSQITSPVSGENEGESNDQCISAKEAIDKVSTSKGKEQEPRVQQSNDLAIQQQSVFQSYISANPLAYTADTTGYNFGFNNNINNNMSAGRAVTAAGLNIEPGPSGIQQSGISSNLSVQNFGNLVDLRNKHILDSNGFANPSTRRAVPDMSPRNKFISSAFPLFPGDNPFCHSSKSQFLRNQNPANHSAEQISTTQLQQDKKSTEHDEESIGEDDEDEDEEMEEAVERLIEVPLNQFAFSEQFRQVYMMGHEPDRKAFLDELFEFMQLQGTPINRVPIMAKGNLDLYKLFKLVIAKGGVLEVINKKQWRQIARGLRLPATITSAAFTLRTQPAELQSAVDNNRRDGKKASHMLNMTPDGMPLSMFPSHPMADASLFNQALLTNMFATQMMNNQRVYHQPLPVHSPLLPNITSHPPPTTHHFMPGALPVPGLHNMAPIVQPQQIPTTSACTYGYGAAASLLCHGNPKKPVITAAPRPGNKRVHSPCSEDTSKLPNNKQSRDSSPDKDIRDTQDRRLCHLTSQKNEATGEEELMVRMTINGVVRIGILRAEKQSTSTKEEQ